MSTTISCFVTPNKQAFFNDGACHSWLKNTYLEYEFNLESREVTKTDHLAPFLAEPAHHETARSFFEKLVGTPEKLMDFVRKGNVDKASLASLLEPKIRKTFLIDICAVLEKDATDKCKNSGDPCLEDGCAFDGTDEVCLNAVLMSEGKCLKFCIDAWIYIFTSSENRIRVWRS